MTTARPPHPFTSLDALRLRHDVRRCEFAVDAGGVRRAGALLVLDSPAAHDPTTDIVLLLTVPRATVDAGLVLVNGSKRPAAIDMRVGHRYRLRLADAHTFRPAMVARLLRDSTLQTWRAVGKDGWELPSDQATVRPSMQQMGNGKTFDFEFIPTVAGGMVFTVSSAAGVELARVPVVVK